jgi:hypothetical protein
VQLKWPSEEALIRRLQDMEREAKLKDDTAQLADLMSKKILVHNPENVIVEYVQILDRIKKGKISYASF